MYENVLNFYEPNMFMLYLHFIFVDKWVGLDLIKKIANTVENNTLKLYWIIPNDECIAVILDKSTFYVDKLSCGNGLIDQWNVNW